MEVDIYRCHNIRGRKLFNSPSKKAIASHKRVALAFTTLYRPLAGESESLATSLGGGDGGDADDDDDGGGGGGTCVAASLATDVASSATAASATKLSKYTII